MGKGLPRPPSSLSAVVRTLVAASARRSGPRRPTLALGLTLSLTACSAGDVKPPEQLQALASAAEVVLDVPAPVEEDALKKVVPTEVVAPPTPPWSPTDRTLSFVLPVDMGIRADKGGDGHFLAPRAHGKHNGIDFLAPVGTPVLAACDGVAKSDERGGYGNVVQLVCKLPKELGGDEGLHASFFYAHLSKMAVPKKWTHVKGGVALGTVGKTGNAKGPKINPHLHLEVIIRGSEQEAKEERHSGVVPEANEAADRFFEILAEECLDPAKFAAKSDGIRRERRADPFVLLMCAAKPKPELVAPEDKRLAAAQVKWSAHYSAGGFDVDRGPH